MIGHQYRNELTAYIFVGISVALFAVPYLNAQPNSPAIPILIEDVQSKAIDLEKKGKWENALHLWCKIHTLDKSNNAVSQHMQICLRRILQIQRQSDLSLREKVLTLSPTQAFALYSEVVSTISTAYIDKSKVTPQRLFQQGFEEFQLSLNDANFRKLNMSEASDSSIHLFQNRLRDFMAVKSSLVSVPEAVELVKQIAATAKRDVHINKTSCVVLEFIAGACNSLDEYTSYLSPLELQVESRSLAELSVVDVNMLKDGLGYLRISHFRESTPVEFDNALNTLKMAPNGMNLRALIVDLRGNHGGLFTASVQVVERFIPEGVIVTTRGRLDEMNKVHSAGGRVNVTDLPLILLVDGQTASAAEVMAASLRDHQRATLVGSTTYGKGSIQRILQFSTGEEVDDLGRTRSRTGGIRITLAQLTSPNGQLISGSGILPHILENDKARQMDIAIEQASRFLSVMQPR